MLTNSTLDLAFIELSKMRKKNIFQADTKNRTFRKPFDLFLALLQVSMSIIYKIHILNFIKILPKFLLKF